MLLFLNIVYGRGVQPVARGPTATRELTFYGPRKSSDFKAGSTVVTEYCPSSVISQ